MREKPLVSVIVTTYNHQQFIREALDSILMQTVDFPYEILIGDDCSTDQTPDILKEYQGKYPDIIKLWIRPQNLGASRNAYELLLQAKGTYLATCEGDDYWIDNEKLALQVEFLEKHEEYIGCTHKFRIVDEKGKRRRHTHLSWVKQKTRFSCKDFCGLYLPGQPSTFVRRNILQLYPDDYTIFYKADPWISDRTAMMRFLEFGDFYCINRYMSCYRQIRKHSLTATLYKQNKNHAIQDYNLHYMLKANAYQRGTIEKYAFERREREIFSDLCISNMIYGNLEAKSLAKVMLESTSQPWKYYFYFLFYCAKKVLLKLGLYY